MRSTMARPRPSRARRRHRRSGGRRVNSWKYRLAAASAMPGPLSRTLDAAAVATAAAAQQHARRAGAVDAAIADRVGEIVLQHAAQQGRVGIDPGGAGRTRRNSMPLRSAIGAKASVEDCSSGPDRQRAGRCCLMAPASSLAMSSRASSSASTEPRPRSTLPHQLLVAMALGQRRHEQARGMQRLQQIVAGGGDEAGLVDIGVLGLGARRFQLCRALDHALLQALRSAFTKRGFRAAALGDVDIEQEEAQHLAAARRNAGCRCRAPPRSCASLVGNSISKTCGRPSSTRVDIGLQLQIAVFGPGLRRRGWPSVSPAGCWLCAA